MFSKECGQHLKPELQHEIVTILDLKIPNPIVCSCSAGNLKWPAAILLRTGKKNHRCLISRYDDRHSDESRLVKGVWEYTIGKD
jgi:hypothetical protein